MTACSAGEKGGNICLFVCSLVRRLREVVDALDKEVGGHWNLSRIHEDYTSGLGIGP